MVGRHAGQSAAVLALAMKRALVALTLVAAVGGCHRTDPATEEAAALIRAQLEAAPAAREPRAEGGGVRREVRVFYEKTGYRPAWFDGKRPRRRWDKLLAALAAAPRHGLDPETYDLQWLTARRGESKKGFLGRESFEPAAIAEIDPRITHAFLKYASHLVHGELDPETIDAKWVAKGRKVDGPSLVEDALESGDVQGALDALAPRHPGYARLAAAMEKAPPERRQQLALNLERWRWLPHDLGTRHIIVNIPAYELRLYDGETEALRMRVVVGKQFDPTPVFSDEITYVTFNPTWNVPDSILAEEILPAVEEDDGYLEKHQMEVVQDGQVVSLDDVDREDLKSFRVRQRPGAHNALGHVKFVFPNPYDIYLHDTPADSLFAREERAFSHGCVRVEKPTELALALLGDQSKWTRAAIEKAMQPGAEHSVKLSKPVPVHIAYWTAWVEADGSVGYGDDVYEHDRTQAAALERARRGTERRAAAAR
jgi:murein L,D-transpeptidase YcbB/YkuD